MILLFITTGRHRLLRPLCPSAGVGHQPAYHLLDGASKRFRRCSCRKCCAAVGALLTPWPGVPGLELATRDVRPLWLPLSRNVSFGCGVGVENTIAPYFVPTPPRPRRCDHVDRVSRVRQVSLTIAASVTFASWVYGSPSRLARVPTKLDLMPAMRGYPHGFGWVRTHLPYQM